MIGQVSMPVKKIINGIVSYQTGMNTYVKFEQTSQIEIGDTLYFSSTPCLSVQAKSSTSCVCLAINGCNLKLGDTLMYSYLVESIELDLKTNLKNTDTTYELINPRKDSILNNEPIASGSFSVSSLFQQTTQSEANRISLRQIIRFNTLNYFSLFNQPSTLNLNGNFQHYYSNFPSNYPKLGRLNIYQACIELQPNLNTRLSIGRSIQTNGLSTLGIFDALRFQYQPQRWQLESVIGFLPHWGTFGVNLTQQVLGMSAIYANSNNQKYFQIGVGTYLQLKHGEFDRLTTASQGAINYRKIQGYYSSDLDFGHNSVRLNNLFTSIQWMANKKWQFFLSYDARQNFILWNSYNQSLIDDLLDNAIQHGLRLRVQCRLGENTIVSTQITNRFSQQLTQMQLFGVQIRQQKLFWRGSQLNYSCNLASYPSWISLQQTLRFEQQLGANQLGLYYRSQFFDRKETTSNILNQSTFGFQFYSSLKKQYRFTFSSEYGIQQQQKIIRAYVTIIKKF